jgi:hypothetical protein
MLSRVALLGLLVVGCNRAEPRAIPTPARSPVAAHVERYVSAGKTVVAYRELAVALADIGVGDPAVSAEAELRLVTLAAPLAGAMRSRPLAEQVQALGNTVWPVLLGIPAYAGETATDYVERVCDGPLRRDCDSVAPEQRAVVVRAAAMRRASERMHDALAGCLECRGNLDWDRVRWNWESLDREASGYFAGLPRVEPPAHVIASQ